MIRDESSTLVPTVIHGNVARWSPTVIHGNVARWSPTVIHGNVARWSPTVIHGNVARWSPTVIHGGDRRATVISTGTADWGSSEHRSVTTIAELLRI